MILGETCVAHDWKQSSDQEKRISSDRSTGSSLLHIINESCYIRMYIVVLIFQNMIMFIQEEEGYLSQIDK